MSENNNMPLDVVTPSNLAINENIALSGSFSTSGRNLGAEGDGLSPCLLAKVLPGVDKGQLLKSKIVKVTPPKLNKTTSTAKIKAYNAEEGAAFKTKRGMEEYYNGEVPMLYRDKAREVASEKGGGGCIQRSVGINRSPWYRLVGTQAYGLDVWYAGSLLAPISLGSVEFSRGAQLAALVSPTLIYLLG